MEKLKCSCGSPFFSLVKTDKENVFAYCMWCSLKNDKVEPKFVITGLEDLETFIKSLKNGGVRTK